MVHDGLSMMNWACLSFRSRSLEDSTEASLLYERDALQSRVESLQNQFEKLKVVWLALW